MKLRLKLLLILSIGIPGSAFLACTGGARTEKDTGAVVAIDVEEGRKQVTALRLSDFGETIRYIPLETTDNCLIGAEPILKVLKNHIVVEARNGCFLFDKKDGRFITAVGHAGQDPEAYSSSFSWTDERQAFLYFVRRPDGLVKYDMNGNFCGSVKLKPSSGLPSSCLITDSVIVGHYDGMSDGLETLSIFDTKGRLLQVFPSLHGKANLLPNDIASLTVLNRSDRYGNLSRSSGIMAIDFKDGTKQLFAPNAATLWNYGGEIRFKALFADTVYTLARGELTPSVVFNAGSRHWPTDERRCTAEASAARIFIACVSESRRHVFFQYIEGLYTDEPAMYNGLYDKESGETKFGKSAEAIADDLTDFMPLKYVTMTAAGEFAALVDAVEIMERIGEHPVTKDDDRPAFLKDFDEDMNPVVVLVTPHSSAGGVK